MVDASPEPLVGSFQVQESIGRSQPELSTHGHRVTERQLLINLVTGALGTGVYSLPWAMAGASVVVGVLIIMAVIAVNLFTIMILVHAAERYQVFDIAAVLSKLPGRFGLFIQIGTNCCLYFTAMMVLTSYIMAIVDSASPFLQGTAMEHRSLISGAAALLVLPMCFLDQQYLAFTSTLAVIVNLYLFGLVTGLVGEGIAEHSLPSVCLLGLGPGCVTMVSTVMMCTVIQMVVLPMYKELDGRSPLKLRRVLINAFTILGFLFMGFSIAVYLAFGPQVQSNFLKSLPNTSLGSVAQLAVILVIAAVYPFGAMIMMAPIDGLGLEWFSRAPLSNPEVLAAAARNKSKVLSIATVVIVFLSYALALVISDLGFVNVVCGALSIGIFTTLGPGLVGLHLLDRTSGCWRSSMLILILVGIVATGLGLWFVDNYSDTLQSNCRITF